MVPCSLALALIDIVRMRSCPYHDDDANNIIEIKRRIVGHCRSAQVTWASVGKFRLSRCAISTRTEFIVLPEPVISSSADGITPMLNEQSSTSPPAILRNGRMSSRTASTPSSVKAGPSGATCTMKIENVCSTRL